MNPKCLVEVEKVSKSYREGASQHQVLREVSLAIPEGRFLSLMGASGSGKTTLLNMIGGLDLPDSGRIIIEGSDLNAMDDDSRSAFRLRTIGFVFQFFNLLQNLSVEENIALPLQFLRMRRKDALARAREVAAEVGLGNKTGRLGNQLSGGEMQRVAIARAIVHQPKLLLADEPTGNLDSKTGHTILELIRSIASSHGVTVVMATHDAKTAEYCDDTIHMRDGRIVAEDAL